MVGQKDKDPIKSNGNEMSRTVLFLIIVLVLLVGGVVLLSRSASEVPVKPVEVDVSRDTPAQ